MVTGFNIRLVENRQYFEQYIDIGMEYMQLQKTKVKEKIKEYAIEGIADGTKIQKDWFPQIDADIFISHSHKDEKLAIGLAGWLYETFGLNCFVDSCVWGYADDLLKIINDKYSDKKEWKEGETIYNYQKCITASKHVDTILTIALHKMIDKSEATFLVNTDNSILKYKNIYDNATYSPWIYSEIICTEIVRKKKISEYRDRPFVLEYMEHKNNVEQDGFSAAYDVSLDHLKDIYYEDLLKWKKDFCNSKFDYPLDCLYRFTYKEACNITDESLFL